MTDNTTFNPLAMGTDSSGYYVTTIGTGGLNTPTYQTSTWASPDYAEKKNLEGWLRILVARIEKLQDKIKELEGKIDGR